MSADTFVSLGHRQQGRTMDTNEHAKRARAYIDELCDKIDRGEALTRKRKAWWIVPVALGLSLTSCGGNSDDSGPSKQQEICDNGIDDDGDGKIDCADEDCADFSGCMTVEYAAPFEEICNNDIDDDGDGKIDCADEDCASFPGCMTADYAAPFEHDCSNGIDDDGDGDTDCDDSDCSLDSNCAT
jgi:hypothetical protein